MLKGQIAVLKWQKLHQQQLEKSAQIKKLNDQISFFKTANSGHDDVLASLEGQVQAQQDKLSDAQHQQHVIHTELTRAEQQQINVKQQTQTLKQNLIKLQQRQTHSTEIKTQQQIVCEQLNETLQEASENALMCEEQVRTLTHELEELLALKQRHNTHWQTLCEQQQQLNNNAQLHSSHIKQTQQQISHVNEQINQLNAQLTDLQSSDVEQQLTAANTANTNINSRTCR